MPSPPSRIARWLAPLLLAGTAAGSEDGAPATPDIVSVARNEAKREASFLVARCQQLLTELRSSTDESSPFVATRIDELASLGSGVVDSLAATMDYKEQSGAAYNAGVNAARALARIPGQASAGATLRLAREGGPHGKRNAALAIGLRKDSSLLPIAIELAKDADPGVVEQALYALGDLGGETAIGILGEHVASTQPGIASAAISGLASVGGDAASDAVLKRLKAEMIAPQVADTVLAAAFEYFAAHPLETALDPAQKILADPNRGRDARIAAVRTQKEVAKRFDSTRRSVLGHLNEVLKQANGSLLDDVAAAMYELGDERGLDWLTAGLDQSIKSDKNNFTLRYQRGDIFLRFKSYKSARNDYLAGLRMEREPRAPEKVYVPLARCSAGLGDFRDASKQLQKLGDQDLSSLPRDYPEFVAMAADPNYEKLFQRRG